MMYLGAVFDFSSAFFPLFMISIKIGRVAHYEEIFDIQKMGRVKNRHAG